MYNFYFLSLLLLCLNCFIFITLQNKGQGLKRSGSHSWEAEFHNKTVKQSHLPSVPTSGPMMMQHSKSIHFSVNIKIFIFYNFSL